MYALFHGVNTQKGLKWKGQRLMVNDDPHLMTVMRKPYGDDFILHSTAPIADPGKIEAFYKFSNLRLAH